MILTGHEIEHFVRRGEIEIEPFDLALVDVNSYGFHLGKKLLVYTNAVIDPFCQNEFETVDLGSEGYLLERGRFYLGYTHERIGGISVATELYANLSTASAGIFIQTSAPLGHSGAVIHWTLEIVVAKTVRIYPQMRIGKICFWLNDGVITPYRGRYQGSEGVVSSRLFEDGLIGKEQKT
jgi:dCTP deaminase